jgi:hypothetical protein
VHLEQHETKKRPYALALRALRDAEPYAGTVTRLKKKYERTAYAMPT